MRLGHAHALADVRHERRLQLGRMGRFRRVHGRERLRARRYANRMRHEQHRRSDRVRCAGLLVVVHMGDGVRPRAGRGVPLLARLELSVLHTERRGQRLAVLQPHVPVEFVRVALLLRLMRLSILAALSVLAACSSPAPPLVALDSSVPDAFSPPPDAFVPADASAFVIAAHGPSTVIPDQGGARFHHPQLVIITFADDANRATLEAHASWLVTSSWLTNVGAEYGVGAGTILANVRRADAAPDMITTAGIEALLSAGVADHSLPRAADGTFREVLYVIYFPQHTMIDDPSLGHSCMAYGGYHYEMDNGGDPFSYAVMPSCSGFNPSLGDLEFEEEAMSHELIEAATDARPRSNPAFEFSQASSVLSPWLFVGPEVGDLCALRITPDAFIREGSFVATRIWSNAAAAANDRDPCIPANPATPYYSVAIVPDQVAFVAAGASTTFEIDAWSTAPVDPFFLYAVASGGMFAATPSLDVTMVNNGDHATLTVGVPAGTPSMSYSLVYLEFGHSTTEYSAWPVVVYVP